MVEVPRKVPGVPAGLPGTWGKRTVGPVGPDVGGVPEETSEGGVEEVPGVTVEVHP